MPRVIVILDRRLAHIFCAHVLRTRLGTTAVAQIEARDEVTSLPSDGGVITVGDICDLFLGLLRSPRQVD